MGTNSPQGARRGWTWLLVALLLAIPAQRAIAAHNGKGNDNAHGGNCNKTKTCQTPTPTPTPAPDTVAPTETIDAPSAGTKVSGTVKVAGTATDDVPVAAVDVAVDGGAVAPASGTETWALPIDTTKLADGSHTVTARATDTSGNTSSAKISVDVNNAPADTTSGSDGGSTGGSTGGGSTSSCDKSLSGGGDIQAALNNLSTGQRLCLSGSFSVTSTIHPKSGQTISGPATIVGKGLSQQGDVFGIQPAVGVTLIDLDISGAGRHGVACWIDTTVMGGRLHHNGKDGLGCDMDGRTAPVLVTGVEIDHNGIDSYWLGLGAGGIKWFPANGVTVKNSNIHDNTGNGVWCDAQCGDFNVLNNTITHNTRKGVFYEKGGESDGSFGDPNARYVGKAVITGNTIRDNDTEGVPQAHPGVAIYSSKNVLIANNNFGGNQRAVIAREDTNRLNDDKHGWHLSNVVIQNNTLNGDVITGCMTAGVQCSGNV